MGTQQAEIGLNITGDLIKNSVKSFGLSKRFTKIMVNCTIFNILVQRMVVSESELKKKNAYGTNFFVFKKPNKVKDKTLKLMLSWMNGIKDSIDKDFLKEIFITMKDPNSDEILESYKVYLKYNFGEETTYKPTFTYVKNDIMAIFEMLLKLGQNVKLPENTAVEIEFTYNDDTPRIYEPPGFVATENPYYKRSEHMYKEHIGIFNTGFHKMYMIGPGKIQNTAGAIENILEKENETEENTQTQIEPESTKFTNVSAMVENKIENTCSPSKQILTNCSMLAESVITILSDEEEDIAGCICGLHSTEEIPIIKCSICKNNVHAPCYGFIIDYSLIEIFRCFNCKTTDTILSKVPKNEVRSLAMNRLLLYFLKKDGAQKINVIKTFPDEIKKFILQEIDKYQLIFDNGSVNEEVLLYLINTLCNGANSQILE